MGNRNGVLSSEEYGTEVKKLRKKFNFKQILSSTAFTKTIRATFNEHDDPELNELRENQQQIVIKIFPRYVSSSAKAINPSYNPAERLGFYSQHVDEIREHIYFQFGTSTNCLPFNQLLVTKHAVFLLRQFIKYNLYDRLSVQPYLRSIEKRWITFQLLNALKELHSTDLVHGDVKIENVLVNSFLWVSLSDLASYKPVSLSKDHSWADYRYFFDISRRGTCCLAPERVPCPIKTQNNEQSDLTPTCAKLTPAMDIFSLGCVLAQLYTERSLFDFSQLIAYAGYAEQPYDPFDELKKLIKDRNMFEMIKSMLSINPCDRKSASGYLNEQHERAFPAYFLPLKNYMAKLVSTRLTSDEFVINLKRNLPFLIENSRGI